MTALTANRATELLENGRVFRTFEVDAEAVIFAGALVAVNTDGYLEPASADSTLKIVGIACTAQDATGLAAGDLTVEVEANVCLMVNGSSSITANDVEAYCYAGDDQTVHLSNGSSAGTSQITRGDVVFSTTDDVGFTVDSLPALFVASDTSDDITATALRNKWNGSAQHFAVAVATIDLSGSESWCYLTFIDKAVHTVAAYSPATADVATITNPTTSVAAVAATRPVAGRIHQVDASGVFVRIMNP